LGTFYQPHAVVADISTLQTLDERAFRAGIAELIKYGLTLSADFFEWMEVHLEAILRRETVALNTAITQAAQFKAQVVMQDETDMKGIRRILNFGHTLAHAIETLLGYQHILHGEAVAIGMVFALKLSVQYIGLSSNIVVRLERMLRQAQLPTQIPSELARSELWSKIKQDKKYLGQALPWVLLKNLGQVAPPQVISQAQFLAIE
jgi:3-dehydroquinate synthase